MKNNIQKDLLLFNQLIEEFLQEEQKTPISRLIQTHELKDYPLDRKATLAPLGQVTLCARQHDS